MFDSWRRFLDHLEFPRVEVRLDFSPDPAPATSSSGDEGSPRAGWADPVDLLAVRAARLGSREPAAKALLAMDR